jgi:pimeloyl-ACP methyl ester carboxylesterase
MLVPLRPGASGDRQPVPGKVDMKDAEPRWLLLHGTPLDPDCWAGIRQRLTLRGPVDVPNITPRTSDSEPQRDIAARLATGYGDGPRDLNIVGHSFGGQVALELALALPQRLRTLTIVCSRDTPYPAFAATAAALRAGARVDVDAAVDRWFTPDEAAADGPMVRYARRSLEHADRSAWAVALDGIAAFDAADRTGAITAPTTLIAAAFDPVSTPQAMNELRTRIPNATLHVLAGAAHMSPFVDPHDLTRRILAAARPEGGDEVNQQPPA